MNVIGVDMYRNKLVLFILSFGLHKEIRLISISPPLCH
jgi:hypothetical protein